MQLELERRIILINNHPNLPGQEPAQQRLVLPAHSEEQQYQPGAHTQRVFVHPDQLRPQVPATYAHPVSKLGALWRDPAYKVLMVAAAMVLISGIVFAAFIFNAFAQQTNSTSQAVTSSKGMTNTATHPINTPPTFPTPSGGQGSTQGSSQPPKTAPVVLPTLTPSTATQQPTNQNLQLQITSIPQEVRNNSDVQVTVTANQPNVSVHLQVTFDNSIITNTAGPQQTDGNGNVTLDWHVADISFKQSFVARITAIATDQNGQTTQSQTVSVQVTNRFKF
jgi:cytoskeletal protein RodZ